MFNRLASGLFRVAGSCCFRIYGKGRSETEWRVIEVHATHRRDLDSRWFAPFWRGTLVTWTSSIIALGWDAAERILFEQCEQPASRAHPLEVPGGRVNSDLRPPGVSRRSATLSEILAHECGHTWQALRLGWLYWPVGVMFTLFREGRHWWNHFENQASAAGQFGGLVNGSVCERLMQRLRERGRGEPLWG
jgi:hypothetical protein